MSHLPIYTVLGMVLCIVILSGCSGEPSQVDIRKAVEMEIEKTNKLTFALGTTELHDVKKLGCKKAADENGYNCDVEIDMTLPLVGRQKQASPIRVIKGTEGWIVMNK